MKFFPQIVHLFPKKIVLPADLKQEIYQAALIEAGTQDSDKYRLIYFQRLKSPAEFDPCFRMRSVFSKMLHCGALESRP